MIGEGWADFHRDLHTEMRFDALVMDVRGNGGGHISQLVVEKLARRVIGWDQGRWMQPASYPGDGRRGPMVTVADEFAGSDGDIVTAAVKLLSLGPVVGTRTWGGVVGIDGVPGHELVDGTHMTVPRYAFSFDEYGWGVENYGVDPDVEVLISPDDWAAGRDPQLEMAVRLALEALEKQPAKVPADPATGPSKVRPALPPREPGAPGARPDVIRLPASPAHPRGPAHVHGRGRRLACPGRGRPGLAAVRRRRAGELSPLLPRRIPAGLDQLARRQPRGLRGRHRGRRGDPAHLLG